MEKEKKYLLIGIPILFIIGAIFHFLYDLSSNNIIIAFISPINESIWEHTKLSLIPIIIYWLIYLKINKSINKNNWYYSLLITLLSYIISIPTIYYLYTGALGIESMIIDILILLVSITMSHLIGLHIYKYKKNTIKSIYSILLICIILVIYIIFTINPPQLPIFIDINNETSGLYD